MQHACAAREAQACTKGTNGHAAREMAKGTGAPFARGQRNAGEGASLVR